jgi:hypothetical protein
VPDAANSFDAAGPAEYQSIAKMFNPPGWSRGGGFVVRLELPAALPAVEPVLYRRGVDEFFTVSSSAGVLYSWGTHGRPLSSFEWHIIPLPPGLAGPLYLHIGSTMATAGVVDNRVLIGSRADIIARIVSGDSDK